MCLVNINEYCTFSLSNSNHYFLRKTVELCKQAEKSGVAWITVHGRTVKQRGEPADWDSIKLVLNTHVKHYRPSDQSTSTRLSTSTTFKFQISRIPRTLAPSRCLPADKEMLETRMV